MPDGSVKSRSIRTDRHTMASIVMSYPVPRSAIITGEAKAKLAAWEARNLKWLWEKYGSQLRVVLAHDDETQPHLHAWLLPDDPGADATTLHPGKVAKKAIEVQAKADGEENRVAVKLGNQALRAAMTLWQDEYHAAVGVPEGLTRSGPRRRRLTRAQWQAEKAAAQAHKTALERAERATAHADAANLYVIAAEVRGIEIKTLEAKMLERATRLQDIQDGIKGVDSGRGQDRIIGTYTFDDMRMRSPMLIQKDQKAHLWDADSLREAFRCVSATTQTSPAQSPT